MRPASLRGGLFYASPRLKPTLGVILRGELLEFALESFDYSPWIKGLHFRLSRPLFRPDLLDGGGAAA